MLVLGVWVCAVGSVGFRKLEFGMDIVMAVVLTVVTLTTIMVLMMIIIIHIKMYELIKVS